MKRNKNFGVYIEAKLSLVTTIEKQVTEKKQALTNLEAVPTLS